MSEDLQAMLDGIVAHPTEALRWLILADWLDDHGQCNRAMLLRIHRELLRTCDNPDANPERPELHARMMELMRAGVKPCIPLRIIPLSGGVELKMSFIPPGSFLMGSLWSEDERYGDEIYHPVTLTRGFWLGRTPVTQWQWQAVMGTDPSHFKGDELPVERVSWDDAQAFCVAVRERTGVNVRLPTEAEWEYAYRAGTTTPFYWGTELNGTQANCDGNYIYGKETTGVFLETTTFVGSYAAVSPHPWGLVDMSGNVWEWCADWYAEYTKDHEVRASTVSALACRVSRGGNWGSSAGSCRAACRNWDSTSLQSSGTGFRIVVNL